MTTTKPVLAGLLAILFLIGCSIPSQESAPPSISTTYKNMSVDELHEQLSNKDFILIDTHIPEQQHINGTDAFIPYDDIENQLDRLPAGKDTKIVLYCRTGRMSETAAQKLADKGYVNVYNVVGGIVEWAKKGYET